MRLAALTETADRPRAWRELVALANCRIDALQTSRLDAALRRFLASGPPPGLATRPIRLAVLSSSTSSHLLAGLRVGGLRRGLWLTIHEPDFGQYLQELHDPSSALAAFRPDEILFAFDAAGIAARLDAAAGTDAADAARSDAMDHIRSCWRLARERFACPIIQQTILPTLNPILGSNEHRLPGSPLQFVACLNADIRAAASAEHVDILAIDTWAARLGIDAWHAPSLWLKAKQEIGPAATPLYGDLAARLFAARQGRSAKALVLDLDNTLWGGVIGDDGLSGIAIGHGSAYGESFLALQAYIRDLAKRGIILAVCSKNDDAIARQPFIDHPDMILRMEHFAIFVANWDDKAHNLRRIAAELNIGLDALVFVDDNPFERDLVRTELPMVAVPEVPEEPALVARCLADAGYFESLGVTADDLRRTEQYRTDAARSASQAHATDLETYLRGLDMRLLWRPFDEAGLARVTQLINKTNQFNLTTRRHSEPTVAAFRAAPEALTLQLRLTDRFGDNGLIAVVIGVTKGAAIEIDTWLMSCRVLGRGVEAATLNVLVDEARKRGATRLVGVYRPTERNAIVRDLYERLGFVRGPDGSDDETRWSLSLADRAVAKSTILVVEA